MDCEPKIGLNPNHIWASPQSRAHIASYPRAAWHGHPLSIKPCHNPVKIDLMKQELMVETSTHSINGRHGRLDRGDWTIIPWYPCGHIYLQTHVDLSSCLIEGYMHILPEDWSKQSFECGDHITEPSARGTLVEIFSRKPMSICAHVWQRDTCTFCQKIDPSKDLNVVINLDCVSGIFIPDQGKLWELLWQYFGCNPEGLDFKLLC
jgi:hypothetical protein